MTSEALGHTWSITVTCRPEIIIVSPDDHTKVERVFDARRFDYLPNPVEVRATNLRDALQAAAELPITAWFGEPPNVEEREP